MAKHRESDVLKNCKNHGVAIRQNIKGGRKYCLSCNKEVK